MALFVTHGGQNSFMEALTAGVPLVVCPGFGDQMGNAARAEKLGIGLKVERPKSGESVTLAAYEEAICEACEKVVGSGAVQKAKDLSVEAQRGGGTEKVVELILEVSK